MKNFTCRTRIFYSSICFIYVFSLCALRINIKLIYCGTPLSGQRFAGKHFKCRYLHQKQYSWCLTTIAVRLDLRRLIRNELNVDLFKCSFEMDTGYMNDPTFLNNGRLYLLRLRKYLFLVGHTIFWIFRIKSDYRLRNFFTYFSDYLLSAAFVSLLGVRQPL